MNQKNNRRIPKLLLELGGWDFSSLNHQIVSIYKKYGSVVERSAAWSRMLRGTPYAYETHLPPIEDLDVMRVRFESFDCITFVYYVIALSGAKNFDDFVQRLYTIRYVQEKDYFISNRYVNGNFIDFAGEAFLFNNAGKKFLVDITDNIAAEPYLTKVEMKLRTFSRPIDKDKLETHIYPRFPDRNINTSIIKSTSAGLSSITKNILAGDLILFTRGARDPDGNMSPFFVAHAAFAYRTGRMLGMIHATRGYYRSKKRVSKVKFPCLSQTSNMFFPGVVVSGTYLGKGAIIERDGIQYHGYDFDRVRSLADYSMDNFLGFKVLRPTA